MRKLSIHYKLNPCFQTGHKEKHLKQVLTSNTLNLNKSKKTILQKLKMHK